jgi:hypothetical protein
VAPPRLEVQVATATAAEVAESGFATRRETEVGSGTRMGHPQMYCIPHNNNNNNNNNNNIHTTLNSIVSPRLRTVRHKPHRTVRTDSTRILHMEVL